MRFNLVHGDDTIMVEVMLPRVHCITLTVIVSSKCTN